jgi:PAS domain S-box-containing protein
VKYLKANQGSFFIVDEEQECLNMVACYAFNKKKYLNKQVGFGEGLLGQAYLEKETLFLTEVPNGYIQITSGLGDAPPRNIVIVPLKINDAVQGVLEIASFQILEKYQVEFLERLGESIASAIATLKINEKTQLLLLQSQQQAEELKTQEEELKQNLEEMQATQEELARKEAESRSILKALNASYFVAELSLEQHIMSLNERFQQLLGSGQQAPSAQGGHVVYKTLFHESADFNSLWEEVLQGKPANRTAKLTSAGGEVWLFETYSPIFDNHNRVRKILVIASDITQNKLQELALRQAQEKLQKSMVELQAQRDQIERRNQEILARNERVERFRTLQVQLAKSAHIRHGAWQQAVEEFVKAIAEEIGVARVSIWQLNTEGNAIHKIGLYLHQKKAYDRNPATLEAEKYPNYFAVLKKGEIVAAHDAVNSNVTRELAANYFDVLGITSILDVPYFVDGQLAGVVSCEHVGEFRAWDSDEIGFVKSICDLVTHAYNSYQQKQQREFILAEKGRMESFLNSTTDNIFLLDINNCITQVNESVVKTYQQSNVQVQPGMSIFDLVAPDDRENTAKALETARSGKVHEEEKRYEFDKIIGFYHMMAFPLKAQGEVVGVGIVTRDITEKKIMEEDINRKNAELTANDEELRQNLEELKAMQESLEVKNQEIAMIREKEKERADYSINSQKKLMENYVKRFKVREQELMEKIKLLESELLHLQSGEMTGQSGPENSEDPLKKPDTTA